MAREFSFEEAIAPPAKAPAPREFSFEEAVGAKPAPKAKAKPVAEEAGYDFGAAMAADIALPEITRSVLEGRQMPAPLPTEDKYVVRPEFVDAVKAQLYPQSNAKLLWLS